MENARRGLMLVLSSPSGAGKTTISRRLLGNDKDITLSVSHTTRAKRKGETDGKDYHFIDKDTFTQMRDEGAFLEWAVVFDNYYGTTRAPVELALAGWSRRSVRCRLARCRDLAQGRGRRRRLSLHPAAVGRGARR